MQPSVKLSRPVSLEELQFLANLPGYGKAEKILHENNLIDFSQDLSYSPFIVHAEADEVDEDGDEYSSPAEGWVMIWAKSLDHANRLAKELTLKDFEWELQDYHAEPEYVLDDFDVVNIEEISRDEA